MKKILIVSDTHGDTELLTKILLENHCDINLHLGDSQLPEYMLSSFLVVRGNCDYFIDFPTSRDLVVENFKIHLEHGDKIYTSLENYINNIDCDIFLFGHLHKVMNFKINKKLVLNPGSLTCPRDANEGSFIILTLDKNKIIDIKVNRIDL